MIARTLGTVPGPIVFGFMIDQTCLLWNTNEDQCLSQGSCKMYDNVSMSHLVMIVLLVWRLMATFSFVVALFFALRQDKTCKV